MSLGARSEYLLYKILGMLHRIREDTTTARNQAESAKLNAYARNDLLLNRLEALAGGLSVFDQQIAKGDISPDSIQDTGRQLHDQIDSTMERGDGELEEFISLARQGRKRSGIVETVAPRKRNKTIYGGSWGEDNEEEEDEDDGDPGPSRSRDEIAAAAASYYIYI